MTAKEKPARIPEDSVPMRVLCCLLAVIAITASFIFGKSPVPTIDFAPMDAGTILVCLWLCIGGCMFSYHYRHETPPGLNAVLKIAAVGIALNLARELWLENLHSQQFQYLYPLVDALIATSIVSCFELRAREDILATTAFGLCLLALAGCSGRSMIFGASVFLYIVLGAVLLCLSARSQSINTGGSVRSTASITRGRYIPALVFSGALLPLFSVAIFSFIPRADVLMDSLVTQLRSMAAGTVYQAQLGKKLDLAEASPNLKAKAPKDFHSNPNTEHPVEHSSVDKLSSNPKLEQTDGGTIAPPAQTGNKRSQQPKGQPNGNEPKANGNEPKAKGKQPKPDSKASKTSDKPPTASTGAGGTTPNDSKKTAASVPPPDRSSNPKADKPATNAAGNPPAGSSPTPNPSQGAQNPPPPEKAPPLVTASKTPMANTSNSNEHAGGGPTGDNAPGPRMDASFYSLGKPMTGTNLPVFTLACNRSVYVTLTSMDDFDGQRWLKSTDDCPWTYSATVRGVDLADCPPLRTANALPIVQLTENFKIKSDIGTIVPVAGIPRRLSLEQDVSVDPHGSLRVLNTLKPGTEYSAICDWPVYSLQDLRQAKSFADRDDKYVEHYLQLPDSQSPMVADLARQIVGNGRNRFAQAETIMSYLRTSCKYTTAPVRGKADDNLVDQFLFQTRSGDCKAFASSFIVLCRAAGIPARFIVGFMPGDFDNVTGTTLVKYKHAHSWAEIYMEPYGWIAFDPTPGGLLPARPQQQYYNYQQIQKTLKEQAATHQSRVVTAVENSLQYLGYAMAVVTAVVSAVAIAISLRLLARTVKYILFERKRRHPAHKIRKKLMKRLRKLGVQQEPADTGADIIQRLEQAIKSDTGIAHGGSDDLRLAVTDFFETYNAVVFGQADEMERLKAIAWSIERQVR